VNGNPPVRPPQPLAALAPLGEPAWLVGGAVRDELLGRPSVDLDVVVDGSAPELARRLARTAGAHAFVLSEAFGAWRVLARDRAWRIDLIELAGGTIEADLARRDLAVNAIARPLAGGGLIDPFGGQADLAARRLRMVGPRSFVEDPLRVIRLARLRAELDFALDPATAAAALASAPALAGVSPERVLAELIQIVSGPRPVLGLLTMEHVGAMAAVLPEVLALRGVQQSRFHHLDVHDHTLATLEHVIEVTHEPVRWFGPAAGELAQVLAEPLANELTRGQALRFGAIFHDIAKPLTRGVLPDGRVSFIGHDQAGGELAGAILTRLRASDRLAAHVAALTRHHLRLGFLVHERPLDRRTVYRYLTATQPVSVDVTVVSVADRLATLGDGSERAVELHLELARELLPAALRFRAAPPRPPVRGDELAAALEIAPGPVLGPLLAELTEAAYAGEVQDAAQAFALARELLAGR
jgi:putative nucleotidyltransferase with HDIG domain